MSIKQCPTCKNGDKNTDIKRSRFVEGQQSKLEMKCPNNINHENNENETNNITPKTKIRTKTKTKTKRIQNMYCNWKGTFNALPLHLKVRPMHYI